MTTGDPQPVPVEIDAARGTDDGFAAFDRFARSVGGAMLHAVECTLAEESIEPAQMTALHVEVADHLLAAQVAAGSDADDDPMPWVQANFGVGPARSTAVVGAFLGDSRDAGVAARHLFDRRDADLLPALIWLAAAVVEQYGEVDVSWLPHGHYAP